MTETAIATMKGIPMPKPLTTGGRRRKYPFDKIAVGEMFFLPGREDNSFATYAGVWGRRLKRTFRTRRCWMVGSDAKGWKSCEADDSGAQFGTGIWRIA